MTTARKEACFEELRQCVSRRLRAYYQRHPEHIDDKRSQEGFIWLEDMLKEMFAILDKYFDMTP